MNKLLLQARSSFKGQKLKIGSSGNFDNSPFVEGLHVLEIVDCTIKEKKDRPTLSIRMKVLNGEDKGRSAWPYAPNLDDASGIAQAARTVSAILGDVIPGDIDGNGEKVLDPAVFLDCVEDYAHQLIGEKVEAKCVNSKAKQDGSHLKDDGTPWQNWFINRGLGDDAAVYEDEKGEEPREVRTEKDSMKVATKKKTAKKKVVKKKVVKRKK